MVWVYLDAFYQYLFRFLTRQQYWAILTEQKIKNTQYSQRKCSSKVAVVIIFHLMGTVRIVMTVLSSTAASL